MTRRTKTPRFALAIDRKWMMLLAAALLAAAVALLVQLNRPTQTVEYLVASRDLASGSVLEAAAFSSMPLTLGASGENYLQDLPTEGRLSRPLKAGQLLALTDVGQPESRFSVVLSPSQPLSGRIGVGSLVDVWFVAKNTAAQVANAPIKVAGSLEVLALTAIDSGLAGNSGLSKIELAVGEAELPALLLASADGGFISVIGSD